VYVGEAGRSAIRDLTDDAFLLLESTAELMRALGKTEEWILVVSASHLSRQRIGNLTERLGSIPEAARPSVAIQLSVSRDPEREWLVTTSPDTGEVANMLTPKRISLPDDEDSGSTERMATNCAAAGSILAGKGALLELLASTPPGHDLFESLLSTLAAESRRISAGLVSGYHRAIRTAEDLLEGYHDVLRGRVRPWPGMEDQPDPVRLCPGSSVHPSSTFSGTCWIGERARVEENCTLHNCVILAGARIGPRVKLRNTLVRADGSVLEGHEALDKYLKVL
jgi:hypothetical protein